MNKINNLAPTVKLVIITDVRFENEAKLINYLNGYLVRINRPSEFSLDPHPSECELDKYSFNYIIENDKSIYELQLAVHGLLLSNQLITPNVYAK